MVRQALFATAAALALATPAYAQSITGSLNYDDNIQSSVINNSAYNSNIALDGGATVVGTIRVDSSATASSDDNQVNKDNNVEFSPAKDPLTGLPLPNGTVQNGSAAGAVAGDGNVAVNAAAGVDNIQSNIGTIGVSTSTGGTAPANAGSGLGSWAHANTTAAQSTTYTNYGPKIDPETGIAATFTDSNTATVGAVGGAGNIGVNSAAGAFNSQQNIMTLAVATDAALADASAGVVQYSSANYANLQSSINSASLGGVTGAGNIAVNAAAGVGNLQHNSLTVSASGAFGGGAGTGGLAGNGGFGG